MYKEVFMKSVKTNLENTIIIKKSKFIAYLYPIDNDDISSYLEKLKALHKGSNHICYAYRFDEKEGYSDDGEPSGTAGSRVLELFKLKGIDNSLAIIIRYFGGIKLGAGPLAKAYQEAVNELLSDDNLSSFVKSSIINVSVSYEEADKLKRNYADYLIDEAYGEEVNLQFNIPSEMLTDFPTSYKKIRPSNYIEKSS